MDAQEECMRLHAFPAALFALALAASSPDPARAADHAEAPGSRADTAADIADVYAWHDNATRRLVAVVTFDGLRPPMAGQKGTYDADVRYTIHLDRNGDQRSDADIDIQFAPAGDGASIIIVRGLPGAPPVIVGRVESVLRRGNAQVFAGLRDDPFFFDLEGFRQTLMTGTLSFRNDRDAFAGTNLTAVVLDMDLGAALGGGTSVDIWATSARATGTTAAAAR
jgi:hypothetical protein